MRHAVPARCQEVTVAFSFISECIVLYQPSVYRDKTCEKSIEINSKLLLTDPREIVFDKHNSKELLSTCLA
jgi:hypothetical protein